MFSIDCSTLADFEEDADILNALLRCGVEVERKAPLQRPSYQFDYREVGTPILQRILGYAGIAVTNTPLGVGGSFEPIGSRGEWVVYPLMGLRKHLETASLAGVQAYRANGSLDRVPE